MYASKVFSRMAPSTLASLIADCTVLQEWSYDDIMVIRAALQQMDVTCGLEHGYKLLTGYGIDIANLPTPY